MSGSNPRLFSLFQPMKEFKTYDEQIAALKSRGLQIKDELAVRSFLERNDYYNVITGYSDIFIDNSTNNKKYIHGIGFDNIKALWSFDKLLRHELFKFMIIVERNIKSKLMYHIAQKYGEYDYLNIDFFNPECVLKASELLEGIHCEIARQNENKNPLVRQYKTQGRMLPPPWILANILSFGQISRLYRCLNQGLQSTIAKDLSRQLKKNIFPKDIITSLKIVNLFRNLCAHDQRLFDFMPHNSFSKKHLVNTHCNSDKASGLFAFVCSMYYLQDADDFNELLQVFIKAFDCIKTFSPSFISIIHSKTGFPKDWRDLLFINKEKITP